MSNILNSLRYTKTHEWLYQTNNIVTIGISDHAQHELGDIVFVDLPSINHKVTKGEPCLVVESVKVAADIYSPVDGKVIEVNKDLINNPELINKDPYGQAWLIRIEVTEDVIVTDFLDSFQYKKLIGE